MLLRTPADAPVISDGDAAGPGVFLCPERCRQDAAANGARRKSGGFVRLPRGRERPVLAPAGGLRGEVPGGDVRGGRAAQKLRAELPAPFQRPPLHRRAAEGQPVVQVLASFPAILLFPSALRRFPGTARQCAAAAGRAPPAASWCSLALPSQLLTEPS